MATNRQHSLARRRPHIGPAWARAAHVRPEPLEERCLLSGLQVPPTYGPPAYIVNMRVADMNNDGHPDLVGVDDYTDGLDVFLNAGDGSFLPPRASYVDDGIATLSVADFTGDGVNDVALGNYYTDELYLLEGNGDGTFRNAAEGTYTDLSGLPPVPPFAQVARNPTGMFTADFNADGRPDLALTMATVYPGINDLDIPEVVVYLNQGGGTFAQASQFRAIYMPRGLQPGDFNGDGRIDLLVVGQTTDYKKGQVAFFAGRGDGTFAPAVVSVGDANTMLFTAADFNEDGVLDVAYGTWLGFNQSTIGHVAVQLGQGDGTFGPALDVYDGVAINMVSTGDFDGDGHADLVASDYGGNLIVVAGRGDGTFRPSEAYIAGAETYKVFPGDFNGDGRTDVAVPDRFLPCGVHIFTAKPDGQLNGVRQYFSGNGTLAAAGGDFNGDGRTDVMLTNYLTAGNTVVMLANADGTFTQVASYTSAAWTCAIALGDLNGDGKTDAVVAGTVGESVSVLIGKGDGTFQSPVNYAAGHYPEGVALADLDGDGKTDLVVASYDGNVRLYDGRGDGTLADPVVIATVGNPSAIAAVDADRDGRPDVIFGDHWASGLTLARNNGDGTFTTQALPVNGSVSHIYTPDLNGDGVPDLVATLPAQGQLAVWLGHATGMYGTVRYVATRGANPETVAFGDLDGDGHLDIAALNAGKPNEEAGTLSLLMGDGAGGFRLVSGGRLYVGWHPEGAVAADFDGDRDIDLAVGNASGMSIVLNTDDPGQMEVVPVDLTVAEGIPFNLNVATLETFERLAGLSRYNATVSWGDNTTTEAVVTQPGGPGTTFVITAGHTYRTGGNYTTTVYVHDSLGRYAVTSRSKVTVTPAALTVLGPVPSTVTAVAGLPTTLTLARFTSANPLATVADFTATISWGDSTTGDPGTIVVNPKGGFDVVGTHTYSKFWDFSDPSLQIPPIAISLKSRGGASAWAYDSLYLVPYPDPTGAIQAQGATITAQAGVPTGTVTVATYNHTSADAVSDDVWAYLTWAGNAFGTVGTGNATVTQPGGPGTTFVVSASLTLPEPGDVTVYVTLIDFMHGVSTSATSVAHVTGAALTTTTTTLATPTPAVAIPGQTMTFVATVAAAGGLTPPAGGTVTFREGSRVLGTAPLGASGQASWATSTFAIGTHNVTADYAGDSTSR